MQKKKEPIKFNQKKVTTNFEIVDAIINQTISKTDPNGSYTGRPEDRYEKPVQDADDL